MPPIHCHVVTSQQRVTCLYRCCSSCMDDTLIINLSAVSLNLCSYTLLIYVLPQKEETILHNYTNRIVLQTLTLRISISLRFGNRIFQLKAICHKSYTTFYFYGELRLCFY
jgi:hypothetical protein